MKPDKWGCMGDSSIDGLDKPFVGLMWRIDHIEAIAQKLIGNHRCQVMVFGPGRGEDIPRMAEAVRTRMLALGGEVRSLKRRLSIDTFALTNMLCKEAKQVVRIDYSGTKIKPAPFETFDISEFAGSYDMVLDKYGVAAKSEHPHRIMLTESDMLAPGGLAYVETVLDKEVYPKIVEKREKIDRILDVCGSFWRTRGETGFSIYLASEMKGLRHWFVIERGK